MTSCVRDGYCEWEERYHKLYNDYLKMACYCGSLYTGLEKLIQICEEDPFFVNDVALEEANKILKQGEH